MHGSSHLHFSIPLQILQGLIYLSAGVLLFLKNTGKDLIPFIPESVLIFICIIGSIIGGFYLIGAKLFRPRIIF
ncbi:MAG: hypothetical protein QXR96_02520 [Candidatus Woesearchaeota archaeon]